MKRKLLLLFFTLYIIVFSSFAEGTKSASPNASTITALLSAVDLSNGPYKDCPADNRIKFYIKDHVNENLYFGFQLRDYTQNVTTKISNGYYRIYNPDGSVAITGKWNTSVGAIGNIDTYNQAVNGPNIGGITTGYNPIIFNPTMAGEHWIEIYQSNDDGDHAVTTADYRSRIAAVLFDFTVAQNSGLFNKIDGRVYSNKWGLYATDPSYSNSATASSQPSIYAYVNQSIVKVAFQSGFEPIAWNVAVNNYGVSTAGTFDVTRKSTNNAIAPSLPSGYDVFLNPPDPSVFPVGSPPATPNFITPAVTGCAPYLIHYYLPELADVKLILNLNGVAGYQAGTSDRILEAFDVSAGDNVIAWDGKDGLGNNVASGTNIKMTVVNEKGRYNIPLYDVEMAKNGILVSIIAPVSIPNATLYWDDSQLTNVAGDTGTGNTTGSGLNNSFTGTVSPAHAWSGNGNLAQVIPAPAVGTNETDGAQNDDFGNVRTINSWGWAATASSSELSLILGCADLSVTKTVDNSTPNVGSNVTFTVTASNAGPAPDAAVVVNDLLPSGYVFVSATPSQGTYANGTGIWTVGSVASGANATLQVVATVKPSGLYANTATISGGQEDPTPANNSVTNTPVPKPVTDLSVTKSAPASVIAGQGLTYTIVVTNNGPSPISSSDQFKVTDALPVGFTATTYSASSGTYTSGTGAWTGANIPCGGSVTLTIDGTVSGSATGSLSNTATVIVPSGFVDPTPANNTSVPAVTTINRQADLSIIKTAAATAIAGQGLTYTITVTNNGPSSIISTDHFTVTDVLPTGFTATTYTPGAGTYVSASGDWTGVTLATGQSVTLTIAGTVNGNATGSISNTASVTVPTGFTDPTPGNNTSSVVTTTINRQTDLSITKSAPASVVAGQALTYTITVTNHGSSAILPGDQFIVSDALPGGFTAATYTPSAGTYTPATGVWTGVTINCGGSVTLTIAGTVNGNATGSITNTASVTEPTGVTDPDGGNNTSSVVTTTITRQADLSITKSAPATVTAGGNLNYVITVTNNGPSSIIPGDQLTITDVLPVNFTATGFTPSSGSYISGSGAWTGVTLPTGASVTLTIAGTVNASATGSLSNTASVSVPADITDLVPGNNTSTAAVTSINNLADLSITKSVSAASVIAGQGLTYTISVTNNGPSTIMSGDNFTVTDVLPTGFTATTYTPGAGTYVSASGDWTGVTLATGQSVTLTIAGTVNGNATGSISNTASVTVPTGFTDPTPGNNSATSGTTTINRKSDLSISKSAPATVAAGQNLSYTITVGNNGPSAIVPGDLFTVVDDLPGGYTATTYTPSAGTYNPVTGAWTGVSLISGGSVTLTIDGKVNAGINGSLDNSVSITSPIGIPDPDNSNNTADVSTATYKQTDLSVVKTVSNANPAVGSTVTFTIVAKNNGPSNATGVNVNEVLPSGYSLSSMSYTKGSWSDPIWNVGNLASGATETLTVIATVNVSGTYTNTATISGTQTDPVSGNNSSTCTPEPKPVISINNPTANEGSPDVFTVGLSLPGSTPVIFTPIFTSVTATVGADTGTPIQYSIDGGSTWNTWTSGDITIPVGVSTVKVSVPTVDDNIAEQTETFTLTANVTSGNTTNGSAIGTGTILENDVTSISVSSPTVIEGADEEFTINLSNPSSTPVNVTPTLTSITAIVGVDTTTPIHFSLDGGATWIPWISGDITIPPGITVLKICVPTVNDNIVEPTETYKLTITVTSGNTTNGSAFGIGTITDNDATTLNLTGFTVTETDGSQTQNFVATLDKAAGKDITLSFGTSNVSALAGSDYTAQTGTVITIPAGSTSVNIPVEILGDLISEPTETFTGAVTLSNGNGQTITLGTLTATATIIDNDALSVSINDVTVNENAGNAIFTVTLNGSTQGALTVDFSTANNTAIAGSDYTAQSGTVTFPAGSLSGTTKTITVPILDDNISEPTETFYVNLNNLVSTATATISDNQGVGTITDNDATTLNLTGFTVTETDGSQTQNFVATLDKAAGKDITLSFGTIDGSALAGSDYTAQTGTVITIPAGSTSVNIPVEILGDLISEPTETFTGAVTLSNGNGQTITLGTLTATATIIDNDALSVSINDVTVNENAGNAIFTVTLNGSTQGALTVDFSTANNTAIAGSDYTAQSGTVTFPAGSLSGTTKTITVPILDDNISEPTDTFYVNLNNLVSTATATISDNQGVGTITDNDATTLNLTGFTVTETDGSQTQNFVATLDKAAGKDITLSFNTSDDSALAGSDYTSQTGTVITIPAGSTSVNIPVEILGDLISEPTEAFTGAVALSNGNGQTITLGTLTATATIIDNDALSVSINDVTVNENAGNAIFTVTLNGSTQGALTVDFSTANNTAIAGSDYTAQSGTVTFPAGSLSGTTKTITVPILDDNISEPTETFYVNLNNLVSGAIATISDNQGIGTITDNDATTLNLTGFTVTETDGSQTQNFVATLDKAAGKDITLSFNTSDDSALAGSDYTSQTGSVITIPAGSTSVDIPVEILGDLISEPTETFKGTVTLSNGNGQTITLGTLTATSTIIDNDALSVSINDVTVNENAGNAIFTVTLNGSTQGVLTVDFSTANNTAIAGSDYTAQSGTVTFPAGSLSGTTKMITVPILDDNISEPTETFYVNLNNLVSGAIATISDNQGVSTITDNDATTLNLTGFTVTETDGSQTSNFVATLDKAAGKDITLSFGTIDGSALAGSDYTAQTSSVITIPAGSTSVNIPVEILGDLISEPTETFKGTVTLSNGNGQTITLGTLTATSTIIDNDALSVSINDVTVNENAGNAIFTVTLNGSTQGALTVDFSTANNTAIAGSDYTAQSGTVTFPAGSLSGTTKTITVPILDDNISEPTETFYVNLNNLVSGAIATISDNQGVSTITDNDATTLNLTGFTVTETDGSQTSNFVATLDKAAGKDITLSFGTIDGSALAGSDYTSQTGSVITIPAGSTSVNIPVEILGDLISEPTETFSGAVTLSNGNGQTITLGTLTATATIIDNDALSVSINDVTVNENAGNAIFTVTLNGSTQGVLTVDFSTANNTAIAGSDYTAQSGTVTFPAGSLSGTTKMITVPILDDNISEPTETFYVNLNNLVSGAIATISDNQGVSTITDNDATTLNLTGFTVTETDGSQTSNFVATLDKAAGKDITLSFGTIDGSALAGSDYTAQTSSVITIPAGSTSVNIPVEILGDLISEPTETFKGTVTLSNGNGQTITLGTLTATSTIIDNDALSVSINDVTVNENAGNAIFTVTLNGSTQGALTVDFSTANNTAIAGSDYTAQSGTVTFPAGSLSGTTKTITVPILDDNISEPTETFYVNLNNLVSGAIATISDNQGVSTITDNDATTLNLTGFTVTETDGSQTSNFVATLDKAAGKDITLSFGTIDGSALAGSDYTAQTSSVITIPAGSTSVNIPVEILGDLISEPTETFKGTVTLSNGNGQTITLGTLTATSTIIDNDALSVSINDVTVNENAGNAIFTVTLNGSTQGALTVDFSTANNTAIAGSDYTAQSGTVTFPAGSLSGTTKTITVPILDDNISEPTETFYVNLNNLVSTATATISDNQGVGTITDNDVVALDDNVTTNEDTSVKIAVLANDVFASDNVAKVTNATSPNNGVVVINPDGTITYTPNPDFNGIDTFTYTVTVTFTDNSIITMNASVTVTVTPVADIKDDSATTLEDTPVTISVLSNDGFSGTSHAVTGVSTPANGNVVINADGTLTYTPNADFNGTDTFTYTVTVTNADGTKTTETGTVTVTVTPVADIKDDSATTLEDTPVTISVLSNDGFSGTSHAVTGVSTPANGNVVINADGTLTYTPNADFNGTDTFTYTVTVTNADGTKTTETGTVTVTVTPVADIKDDSATTLEDTPVTIPVLSNDGFSGTNHAVTGVSTPVNGSVIINTDGTVTYTPNADFNGTDTFTYTVTITNPDGTKTTETGTVTVTVTPVTDIKDDLATTLEDTPVTIPMLSNDGFSGTSHAVTGVSTPANGSVVINADDTVTYTPNADFNGTDTFTYTVTVTNTDGTKTTETGTVTVTVAPVNDAPVGNDISITTPENTPISGTIKATDVDGDILIFNKATDSTHGTVVVNSDGTYTYTPDTNYIGPDSFSVTANDGNGGVITIMVTITVTPVNQPPVAVDDAYTTLEDRPLIGNVLSNDSDPENNPLTLVKYSVNGVTKNPGTFSNIPNIGTIAIVSDGSFTFTPVTDYAGTLPPIAYVVSDGVLTDTANVKITVLPLPEVYKSSGKPVMSSDGTFRWTYTIKLVNDTNQDLDSIQVEDNLDDVFKSKGCTYEVTKVIASGGLIANGLFNGSSVTKTLLEGGALKINDTDSIEIEVKVNTQGQTDSIVVYNQALYEEILYNQNVSILSDDISIPGTQDPTKTVIPETSLFIPDAFSPNEDGINDKFVIVHPTQMKIEFEVFNRWDNKVFSSKDYQNDWDGKGTSNFLGRELPNGTYYCVYKAINTISGEVVTKGVKYITLRR